jgi:hypothetical protein
MAPRRLWPEQIGFSRKLRASLGRWNPRLCGGRFLIARTAAASFLLCLYLYSPPPLIACEFATKLTRQPHRATSVAGEDHTGERLFIPVAPQI